MNILPEIEKVCCGNPDKTAIIQYLGKGRSREITYGNLWSFSSNLSRQLLRRSLKPGQSAGIYMQRCPEHVISILAILQAGSAFYSLNPKLTIRQLNYVTGLSKSPFLLIGSDALLRISASAENTIIPSRLVCFTLDPLNRLQESLFVKLKSKVDIELNPPGSSYPSFEKVEFVSPGAEDIALALFTSGSTGFPKGVKITHSDLLKRVDQEISDFRITPADRLLSLLPFSFDVGLNQLFTVLLSGAALVISNSWMPRDICDCIEHYRITGVSGVPAIWNQLISYEEDEVSKCLAKLRYFTVSGGDMSEKQLFKMRRLSADTDIYKTYGQTETFRSSILRPEDFDRKLTSVGKAVEGTKIFIVDSEGRQVKEGGEGEIVHWGDGTMAGYIDSPDETDRKKRMFTPLEMKAVFTGDTGKFDAEGYLYILGRKDKMLKISGNRVYPAEIVNEILTQKGIKETVVIGIKNADGETESIAEVIPEADEIITENTLLNNLRKILPSYMIPDRIVLVTDFPRTENGKVMLSQIEAKYYVQK